MKLAFTPPNERETTINIMYAEDTAEIYTCDPTIITKLEKVLKRDPEHVSFEQPDKYGVVFKMPKSYIKFHPKRELSEAQMERLKSIRNKS